MNPPDFGFRTINHTADLAIQVDAEILPEIYIYCAQALTDELVGLENVKATDGERIEIFGRDLEELLIKLLSELLYRFSTRKFVYKEFIVEYLNHEKVIVYAQGEPFNETRHVIRQEIKAATYHNLSIEPTDEGFSVTVIFDI